MKQIVILSGKGGTGKTTVAAALAHLASQEASIVLADADVDAANLELLLAPRLLEEHDFIAGKLAVIEPELCTGCGLCAEVCRFEAVQPPSSPKAETYVIDPIACEGCAVCYYQCPAEAIRLEEPVAGRWFRSETRFGPLFHAHLFAGRENSGKLVAMVKQSARLSALEQGSKYLVVDGPPGIGCPVIASLTGADLTLLVTEPTVAGTHDLERALVLASHFRVPAVVCINKYDLSLTKSKEIANYCAARGLELVGQIPFAPVVTEAMVRGLPVTEFEAGPVKEALCQIWERLRT
ncbi:MAG: ATP-binding protein [Anaerolineae bacterium]